MNANGQLLFIVANDGSPRRQLATHLQLQGFGVVTLASFAALSRQLDRLTPQLILLDVDIAGTDGLHICRALRARGDMTPLILLGGRCEAVDRVLGLEMGADDFIGKPFVLREVSARVKAVLRRQARVHAAAPAIDDEALVVATGTFSRATRRIGIHGRSIVLSEIDSSVLAELVSNPEAVISRQRLLAASRPAAPPVRPAVIDRTVLRLRRLIEPDAAAPRYIRSVRCHGYVYSPTGG